MRSMRRVIASDHEAYIAATGGIVSFCSVCSERAAMIKTVNASNPRPNLSCFSGSSMSTA